MKRRIADKIRATVFFVLLFLCCLPVVKGVAAETETQSGVQAADVVVNYSTEILTVKANENTELYYGFGTAGKPPKAYQKIGSRLIAEYSNGETTYDAFYIDLSSQTFKAGTVFYAKYEEDAAPVSISLGTRESLKAVYNGVLPQNETGEAYADAYALTLDGAKRYRYFDAETGYLTFKYADENYTKLENIEWRAGATNYRELSDLNLKIYQPNGSSLYFRVNSGTAPISKEAKLKIVKPAKAPSVKLDGSKLTVAVKDTQEYRLEYADGSKTEWTDVEEGTKVLSLSELQGIKGDGIVQAFSEAKILIRNAATEKKPASYVAEIYLDVPGKPEGGENGISVSAVNPADPTKGIKVHNASENDYLVALADTNAWECEGSIPALIKKLDYTVKNGAEGYLAWKTVKAGGSLTFSYSSYKNFADSYAVLFRLAPVKEDKTTPEREFRITSVVKAVGGVLPTADLKSQAFLITGDGTLSKTVTFREVEGYTLYTSVDGGEFAENKTWTLSISGAAGDTVVVKAYLTENTGGEAGDTVAYRYNFVKDGELDAYKNDWGYIQCKKNGWALAYQRAYLAAVTYEGCFSTEGLSMENEEIMQVIKMMRLDNPEIIQIGNRYSVQGSTFSLTLSDRDTMDALLTECQETAEAALDAIREKYNGNPTKIEYVKEIHDFIVLEKQYKSSAMDQTMAGILTDAYTPVCSSYALTFHYMCELAGIQTVIVHGDAMNSKGSKESHVWNMVNLGENVDYARMVTESGKEIDPADWYEIDLTWDDPVGGDEDYVRYTYFNLTTDAMNEHSSGTKHIRSTGDAYDSYPVEKCTGTTYNYDYLVNNKLVSVQ